MMILMMMTWWLRAEERAELSSPPPLNGATDSLRPLQYLQLEVLGASRKKNIYKKNSPQKIFARGHWGIKEMIAKRSQLLALAHVSGNLDWSIAQCAVCAVCFPSNRTSWDIYYNLCVDISFNIYLSQLVRLEGKLDFQGNRNCQTLNLGFPGHFDWFWVFQK